VRRLLWTGADELRDRAEALGAGRRGAALPGLIEDAEDAVAQALAERHRDKLRTLARQLRDVAGRLEAAGRRPVRRQR
jgi:hypothetical protein